MSLLPSYKLIAGTFALGFISDIAATRYSIAAPNRWVMETLWWNLVLMIMSVFFVRRAKSNWLAAAWIVGNLAGCAVAFTWR